MNAAEVHLMLNHVPILGTIFVTGLLVYGIARGQEAVVRVAFWALFLVGVVGVATYLTGEPAEEIVEEAVSVPERVIDAHEDFALWGLITIGVAGLVALAGLFVHRSTPIGNGFAGLVLILTLIAFGAMAYTAYLGGRINHPEIRSGGTMTGGEGQDAGRREAEEGERSGAPIGSGARIVLGASGGVDRVG